MRILSAVSTTTLQDEAVWGGFIAMGIIGLFVGAIVLSVGYKLFLAWLEGPEAVEQGI